MLVAILRDKYSKDSSIHIQHLCLPRKLKRNMPVTFASIQKISVVQTYKTFSLKNNTHTILHTTKLAKPNLCGLRTQFPSNNLLAEFILMNEMDAKKKLLSASAQWCRNIVHIMLGNLADQPQEWQMLREDTFCPYLQL